MKKIKYFNLLLVLLLFLVTGCSDSGGNKIYKSAIEDYENGKYLEAMNKFETLEDYKDSSKKYKESVYKLANSTKELVDSYYYFTMINNYKNSKDKLSEIAVKIADDYYSKGDILSAVNWLKKTSEEDKINEMMYQYIIQNKNGNDIHTYDFLKELSNNGYKDSQNIMDDLYKISYNMILNTNADDKTTDLQLYNNSVWTHDDLYVHIIVNGGYPGQKVKYYLKYETLWGRNNIVDSNTKWEKKYLTEIDVEVNKPFSKHTTGIASNLYYHKFTLYDEKYNELMQKTIHTPYY